MTMTAAQKLEQRRSGLERLSRFVGQNLVWLPAIALLFWTLVPLVWSVSASFKQPLEVYQTPPRLVAENPSFQSYRDVIEWPGFWRFVANSAVLAVSSTLLAVVLSILAAYGFARYAFRFRHLLLMLILVPRILPRVGLIVPLYLMLERFGLLNTHAALIITYTASAIPLSTWILVGFIKAVPKELEESAAIDGATFFQRLRYIVVPMALPGIVTVCIFALRESWNEFPFVLAFTTSSDMRTLPYQLFLLRDSIGIENWPMINAFAILTMVPILMLYIVFERHITSSLASGAVK